MYFAIVSNSLTEHWSSWSCICLAKYHNCIQLNHISSKVIRWVTSTFWEGNNLCGILSLPCNLTVYKYIVSSLLCLHSYWFKIIHFPSLFWLIISGLFSVNSTERYFYINKFTAIYTYIQCEDQSDDQVQFPTHMLFVLLTWTYVHII